MKITRKDIVIDAHQGETAEGLAFGFIGLRTNTNYRGWFFTYPCDSPVIRSVADREAVVASLELDSEVAKDGDPTIPLDLAQSCLRAYLRNKFDLRRRA